MILGFKDRFVPLVADGTKPHTIRAGARWQVGQSIQFYENVRQPTMRKFREDAVVLVVQRIVMERSYLRPQDVNVFIGGRFLTPLECQVLACTDGFDCFVDLVTWIEKTHGLPFAGQLVGWTDLRY